jgi:hypothetical protein
MSRPAPLAPADFIAAYSPERDAELALCIVDERPAAGGPIRRIVRRLRSALRPGARTHRDLNDVEAERVWSVLGTTRGAVPVDRFVHFLAEQFASDYLRTFEYPFLARCLARPDVRTDVVVDMGGGNSYSTVVPLVLCPTSSRVVSIDVVNHDTTSRYGVEYVRGNCIDTSLPTASADVVAIISTLEHVGLGRWGDPLDAAGDIRAMEEARRILRPGGHAVLTIPYGYPTVVFNLHRIYDRGRIGLVTRGFEIVTAEYTAVGRQVPREEIEGARMLKPDPGMARKGGPLARAPQIPGGGMFLLRKSEHAA